MSNLRVNIRRFKSFGEYICRLELTSNISWINNTELKAILHEMTVNFNMICPFMKDRICSNINNGLTVAVKRNGTWNRDAKMMQ